MKKLCFTILCMLTMTAFSISVGAAMPDWMNSDGYDRVIFEENFGDYKNDEVITSNGWEVSAGSTVMAVDAVAAGIHASNDHGVVAKFSSDSTNANVRTKSLILGRYSADELKYLKVEIDINVPSSNPCPVSVRFYPRGNTNDNNAAILGVFNNANGKLEFVDSTGEAVDPSVSQTNYISDTWHSLVYYFDFNNGSFTAYFDGERVVSNASFLTNKFPNGIGQMSVFGNAGARVIFDNVRMSLVSPYDKETNDYDKIIFAPDLGVSPYTLNYSLVNSSQGITLGWSGSSTAAIISAATLPDPEREYVIKHTSAANAQQLRTPSMTTNLGYTPAQLKQVKVEYDLLLPVNMSMGAIRYPYYGVSSGMLTITADGTYTVDGKTREFTANEWHKITCYFDFYTNTYTSYIDGELVAKYISFTPDGTGNWFDRLIIQIGASGNTAYYDNIKISIPSRVVDTKPSAIKITKDNITPTTKVGKVFYRLENTLAQNAELILVKLIGGKIIDMQIVPLTGTSSSAVSFSAASASYEIGAGESLNVLVWSNLTSPVVLTEQSDISFD